MAPPASSQLSADKQQKKPRHRHSPNQIAALNDVYDRDEHPDLSVRTSLAQSLGMETKTVNSWFQNKRASNKKKTTGRQEPSITVPPPVAAPSSSSSSLVPQDDGLDPASVEQPLSARQTSLPELDHSAQWANYSDHSNSRASRTPDMDSAASRVGRLRQRPTQQQAEELKEMYKVNPLPSSEERQTLADRIGMRYTSVTNWFQNQRSKKKSGDELPLPIEPRTFSAFPPPSQHPSLPSLPPSSTHPSLAAPLHHQDERFKSPSISSSLGDEMPARRANRRRSVTPYSNAMLSRTRRSRPDATQLDALKQLFDKTATPSIEERTNLAFEVGMDVTKVTNWFRNIRQTSRRRESQRPGGAAGSESGDEYDHSRSLSPAYRSALSDDGMDVYDEETVPRVAGGSDGVSDEEDQEALTPSPEASPKSVRRQFESHAEALFIAINSVERAQASEVAPVSKHGVHVEDAMLLLSFHRNIVE